MKQAAETAENPVTGLMEWAAWWREEEVEEMEEGLGAEDWIWTIPTPMARKRRAIHLD